MDSEKKMLAAKAIPATMQAWGTFVGGKCGNALAVLGIGVDYALSYWGTIIGNSEKEWMEKRFGKVEAAVAVHEKRVDSVEKAAVKLGTKVDTLEESSAQQAKEIDKLPQIFIHHMMGVLHETNTKKHAARRAFLVGRVAAGNVSSKVADAHAEVEQWLETAVPLDIDIIRHIHKKEQLAQQAARHQQNARILHNTNTKDIAQSLQADEDQVKRRLLLLYDTGVAKSPGRARLEQEVRPDAEVVLRGGPPAHSYPISLMTFGKTIFALLQDYEKELAELQAEEAAKKKAPA